MSSPNVPGDAFGVRQAAEVARPDSTDRTQAGSQLRRTKIVTTIGPATRSVSAMRELIEAGADVFRLNFSHGTSEQHAETISMARTAAREAGREIALLGDLPGPKLRLGSVPGGVIELEEHETVTFDESLAGEASYSDGGWTMPVRAAGLASAVHPGDEIFLADGKLRLRAGEVSGSKITATVEVGGRIASHQGINVPGSRSAMPEARRKDLDWVDFAADNGIDLLAVSFVRHAEDLHPLEERLAAHGSDIPLIAKIEKPEAAERADEIVKATLSGIMVARGDLGIELPLASVPVVQKRLLAIAGRHSRPAITATQMLASMVSSSRPTRAEVSDVASAIYQGTDAVMLSEETAVGDYPAEAVRVLDSVARETELDLPYGDWVFTRVETVDGDVAGSVARAAVGATYTLGLAALVVPTHSGRTARLVSAHRPRVPIVALSTRIETVRRLSLLFGVIAILQENQGELRDLLDDCARIARECGAAASGELIGITAGLPEQELGTNLFEVHRVP